MSRLDLHNSTDLDDRRLARLAAEGIAGWAVGTLTVRVRYSRSADFSGTCFYADRRIYVNLGRHLVYPYRLATHLARAATIGRSWYKPAYVIEIADAYQLVAFVFMHELYHLLVKRARRNTRQKESMCDRFAARFVVDRFGLGVFDPVGRPVPRGEWDFQDLERFVDAARDRRVRPLVGGAPLFSPSVARSARAPSSAARIGKAHA
ncbi:MAG: hypothetical protein ACE5EX_10465 [Phycisphaerae bacterium]